MGTIEYLNSMKENMEKQDKIVKERSEETEANLKRHLYFAYKIECLEQYKIFIDGAFKNMHEMARQMADFMIAEQQKNER